MPPWLTPAYLGFVGCITSYNNYFWRFDEDSRFGFSSDGMNVFAGGVSYGGVSPGSSGKVSVDGTYLILDYDDAEMKSIFAVEMSDGYLAVGSRIYRPVSE